MIRWLLLLVCCGFGVAAETVHLPADDSVPRLVSANPAGGQVLSAPQTPDVTTPNTPAGVALTISAGEGRGGWSNAVRLLVLMTVLSLAPGLLMLLTSFTRIIIVLGFVRRALGTQTLPPNQVLIGLALFLTLFVMAPTIEQLHTKAWTPYTAGTINEEQALGEAGTVMRDFLGRHTRKSDLALFIHLSQAEKPKTMQDVPFTTLVPAFITSELKTAFQMGFIIFLPFLVIDMVIAAVLMALGMMMLPPVVISLPFKILLFVLVDGWGLLMQGLVASYAR